jgi:hypothetical protein
LKSPIRWIKKLVFAALLLALLPLPEMCEAAENKPIDIILVLNRPQKQGFVYTVAGWNKLASFVISPDITGVFVCPTGFGAIFTIPAANSIQVWAAAPLNQVKTIGSISGPVKVFFDNACSQALIVGTGFLYKFDLSKSVVTQIVQYSGGGNNQYAIASPDGTKIYLAENGNIEAVDFVTMAKPSLVATRLLVPCWLMQAPTTPRRIRVQDKNHLDTYHPSLS